MRSGAGAGAGKSGDVTDLTVATSSPQPGQLPLLIPRKDTEHGQSLPSETRKMPATTMAAPKALRKVMLSIRFANQGVKISTKTE